MQRHCNIFSPLRSQQVHNQIVPSSWAACDDCRPRTLVAPSTSNPGHTQYWSPESLPGSPSKFTATLGILPPQRRTPIDYDCGACGAYNVDTIRFTRRRNQYRAVRIRAHRAYEKSPQLHKKRLAEKGAQRRRNLAYVTAKGSVSTVHLECWSRRTDLIYSLSVRTPSSGPCSKFRRRFCEHRAFGVSGLVN
jgi:hypothetical protein